MQVYWQTPRGKPQYLNRSVERSKFRFTTNRPWTGQFKQQNQPGTMRKKVFLEPIGEFIRNSQLMLISKHNVSDPFPENWTFFKGDRVEVLVGKDKGKQGIVKQVIEERNWVIVEGLNWHYRKVGQDANYPGVIIKSEAPLLVTDQVALVDPNDLLSTGVEWRFTEEGERVRVSSRSGRIIPMPKTIEETMDYKSKSVYVEKAKDTAASVASQITFKPKLSTFEMDIMEEQGLVETGVPKRTYWY